MLLVSSRGLVIITTLNDRRKLSVRSYPVLGSKYYTFTLNKNKVIYVDAHTYVSTYVLSVIFVYVYVPTVRTMVY